MRLRQALVAAAHSGEALQGAGGSGAVVGHPVACWLKYGGQCGQCLTACDTTQTDQGRSPTLEWKVGLDAVRETMRQRREDQS